MERLKEIYQDKLVEEVKDVSSEYYYFYKNKLSKELFAISKTISHNEYHLLKELYNEKKIYILDKTLQLIYEYLFENKEYPFKTSKVKMIIFDANQEDVGVIEKMLFDIYTTCKIIEVYNLNVCFLEENQTKIKDLFDALSADLGYDITLHEGLTINHLYCGIDILEYIELYHCNKMIRQKTYSDLADMILGLDLFEHQNLKRAIKDNLFLPLVKNANYREIINVMLKNDLNVSQTAKLLYMNRNSLIHKLDNIYKETGLNLQKFTHACVIYLMIHLVQ